MTQTDVTAKILMSFHNEKSHQCLTHLHTVCVFRCYAAVLCCGVVIKSRSTNEVVSIVGAATQSVIPDLGNGFTEIMSLTWRWMCNLWVSNGSEISWPCIISAAAEIEHCFFLLLLLFQGRWNCWYPVHTNKEESLMCCFILSTVLLGGLFYIYLSFSRLLEHVYKNHGWPLNTPHLKKTKKHWTHYNTRTVAHSFGSNNYNLTAVINFAYRRWFLFWLQLYRKVELWESIISLAVLDINTLAASSTATLHFVKNSTHELESTAAALKCTL